MKTLSLFLILAITAQAQGLGLAGPGPGTVHSTGGGGGSSALISSGCEALGPNGGTTSTTGVLNTTGANFIWGNISWYSFGSGLSAVTESKSNGNATLLTTSTPTGGSASSRLFYWTNPTVGSGHTFTFTGSSIYAVICIEAWSNMATSSVLDTSTNEICTGSTNTTCPIDHSISPSAGVKVIALGWTREDLVGTPCSNASGITVDQETNYGGGNNMGGGIGYKIQTPNGVTIQPTVTCPMNANPTASIAAFKGN